MTMSKILDSRGRSEQFGSIIRTDIGKFGHVIKTANIKFDK